MSTRFAAAAGVFVRRMSTLQGRFEGRTVIVTGGAKGIGEGCVRVFHREGARVAILDKDLDGGMKLAKQLNSESSTSDSRVVALPCDVTQEEEVRSAIESAVSKWGGRLDCLVNNAGWHPPPVSIDQISTSQFHQHMDVNLTSTFWGCKYALPHLRNRVVQLQQQAAEQAQFQTQHQKSAVQAELLRRVRTMITFTSPTMSAPATEEVSSSSPFSVGSSRKHQPRSFLPMSFAFPYSTSAAETSAEPTITDTSTTPVLSVPSMVRGFGPSIVTVSSLVGVQGQAQAATYAAAKAGQIAMTKALARDLGHEGIRVNCVCPSNVLTPLMTEWASSFPSGTQRALQMVAEKQVLGRLATIEEIGNVVLFLASNDASFITGQALVVDGGATLG